MTEHTGLSNDRTLAGQILKMTGINAATCYQCGKCSAGCPMAEEMPLPPHQMIRLVQLNRRDKVLADESMWLCLTCETCTTRCPNEVDPARLIDGLREIVFNESAGDAPRRILASHRAFLSEIKRHGRVFEFGVIAEYKLRSGALFDDLTAAPGMFTRGKLALVPRHIKGIDEVRRIFAACESAAHKEKP